MIKFSYITQCRLFLKHFMIQTRLLKTLPKLRGPHYQSYLTFKPISLLSTLQPQIKSGVEVKKKFETQIILSQPIESTKNNNYTDGTRYNNHTDPKNDEDKKKSREFSKKILEELRLRVPDSYQRLTNRLKEESAKNISTLAELLKFKNGQIDQITSFQRHIDDTRKTFTKVLSQFKADCLKSIEMNGDSKPESQSQSLKKFENTLTYFRRSIDSELDRSVNEILGMMQTNWRYYNQKTKMILKGKGAVFDESFIGIYSSDWEVVINAVEASGVHQYLVFEHLIELNEIPKKEVKRTQKQ